MIAKGTALAVDYDIKPSNGRLEIVWKAGLTTVEFAETAEAQVHHASKAEAEDWPNTTATTTEVESEIATATASVDEPAPAELALSERAPVTAQPKPEYKWANGPVIVRKRKSWREATIVSCLEPNHWRAEYLRGGPGMFQRSDIRAYDAGRDATPARQRWRAKATTSQTAPRSRCDRPRGDRRRETSRQASGRSPPKRTPITRSISTGCLALPALAIGTRCATTRSKVATAFKMVARYRQDLLAVHAAWKAAQ